MGQAKGPRRYIAAYRHIVDLMRSEGAANLRWIWHVNWFDEPEAENGNRFGKLLSRRKLLRSGWPVSVYGPLTPRATDGPRKLALQIDEAYPRLTTLAPWQGSNRR